MIKRLDFQDRRRAVGDPSIVADEVLVRVRMVLPRAG
jgi:hypothetical protein